MQQSRLSVKKDFPSAIATEPYTININGQYEWVDNYLTFGDLIEEHMGKEARDFYFDSLYKLLSLKKTEAHVAPKEKPNGTKSREAVRGNSKRLF